MVHYHVNHGGCAKVLEIKRKLGATARVDSGVRALPWCSFERLTNDELVVSVGLASDAEDVIA